MINFNEFLSEAVQNKKALTHLSHVNYLPLQGHEGVGLAADHLENMHKILLGKPSTSTVSDKFDGTPSIVFGIHPKTGRHFVATKSAFNKDPKINYTEEDIDRNHGHAPGLAAKLKQALRELPKIMPRKGGVFQGDLMHSGPDDVQQSRGMYSFTPNTITYSTPVDSAEGKKLQASKMGIVVHTKYKGKGDLQDMEAGPLDLATRNTFQNHPDVHNIDPTSRVNPSNYTLEDQTNFLGHMAAAKQVYSKMKPEAMDAIAGHEVPLEAHMNEMVRTGGTPSVGGYIDYLQRRAQRDIDSVKTPAAKERKQQQHAAILQHVIDNQKHFGDVIDLQRHLRSAKDVLAGVIAKNSPWTHSINGVPSGPEGSVIVNKDGNMAKIVPTDFSRENFLGGKMGQQKITEDTKYVVKKGDNAWDIAKSLGVDFKDFEKANKDSAPLDLIHPGQELNVPGVDAPVPQTRPETPDFTGVGKIGKGWQYGDKAQPKIEEPKSSAISSFSDYTGKLTTTPKPETPTDVSVPLPKTRPEPPVKADPTKAIEVPLPRPRPTPPPALQAVRPGVGTGGIEPSKKFKYATSVADAKWDIPPTDFNAPMKSKDERVAWIKGEAIRHNVDPNAAMAVFKSEGQKGQGPALQATGKAAGMYKGAEDSWGPFQHYLGGGLGNELEQKTGRSLRNNPSNEKAEIRDTMNYVSSPGHNWNQWYGADVAFGKTNDNVGLPSAKEKRSYKHALPIPAANTVNTKTWPYWGKGGLGYGKAQQVFGEETQDSEPEDVHHSFWWGRGNPITRGHELGVNQAVQDAKDRGGSVSAVFTGSQDPKKNPLTPEQKLRYARAAFPDANPTVAGPETPTILHYLSGLHKAGVTNVHLHVGSDRVDEFKRLMDQYNGVSVGKDGKPARHGFYNFKEITVTPVGGERKEGESSTDLENISATGARAAAAEGNRKRFHELAASGLSTKLKDEMMRDVNNGMVVQESVTGSGDTGVAGLGFVSGTPAVDAVEVGNYVATNTKDSDQRENILRAWIHNNHRKHHILGFNNFNPGKKEAPYERPYVSYDNNIDKKA